MAHLVTNVTGNNRKRQKKTPDSVRGHASYGMGFVAAQSLPRITVTSTELEGSFWL